MLVATADRARKIGLRSRIRVSSTSARSPRASKPGAIERRQRRRRDEGDHRRRASEHEQHQVRDRRDDAPGPRLARSPATSAAIVGMTAEARAPAATSWKSKSGIRNAAV